MQLTSSLSAATPHLPPVARSRELYAALLDVTARAAARPQAVTYLRDQLELAADQPCDLPDDPAGLEAWLYAHNEKVGEQYQDYLKGRRAGAPRRYFSSKSHALYFLQGVAPTKLVDGAWLYGLLQRWQEPRFRGLIQTYLEELGEGEPDKNHVVLYRKLLESLGCDDWQNLEDQNFVQGAIQLSLAEHADTFLPEVIGFNLGYEQLPLHLLITSYELTELGIDPYYFTLHVTVDNADNGHAQKAVQSLRAAWPRVGDGAQFYARVKAGYRLNELGASTLSVIASFDPEREVRRLFEKKAAVGQFLHSDYCRFDGRTVNQWLAEDASGFLDVLQRRGWIKRNHDPSESRFWHLVAGEQAPMFGVFSAYEQQLLHDWIAGDWLAEQQVSHGRPGLRLAPSRGRPGALPEKSRARLESDFDDEARRLQQQLSALPGPQARMQHLVPLLSPIHHHTHAGLLATRMFTELFN